MKKLVAITMTVLAAASMTMAMPSFTLPPVILTYPGETIQVRVGSTGGDVQGMTLYLAVDGPLDLDGLVVDAPGMVFTGNISGGTPYIEKLGPGLMYADFATNAGTAALGADVATVLLSCPIGAPFGYFRLTTNLEIIDPVEYEGVFSSWAGAEAGQATAVVYVIPEPATALLLLAAVPLLRTRHA